MTIDERLEAITHNIEILFGMQMSNERRFAETREDLAQIGRNFDKVHDSIKALENIAMAHEERLDDLEGK